MRPAPDTGSPGIKDHIDDVVVRIDPDKMTPLESAAQSADYLSGEAWRAGRG